MIQKCNGPECLHTIHGDTHLRCCICGDYRKEPKSGDRVDYEHIPAGPFMPSIKYANQYPVVVCEELVEA